MSITPKVLAFAGSTRTASFNKKLVRIAAEETRRLGAEVTLIDLRDFPMPLYDGDIEAGSGLPENAIKLKGLIATHHGLLLSLAEYNNSLTGVWKNSMDWASRAAPGEKTLDSFRGKVAALLSAAPGKFGGIRGLSHARDVFTELKVIVLPEQVSVTLAGSAFDQSEQLVDPKLKGAVTTLCTRLVATVKSLHHLE